MLDRGAKPLIDFNAFRDYIQFIDMYRHTKTHLWDVSDLENPEFKSTYESNTISIDHNQYVHKNYTWQSNYVSGLQVLYIDQERYDLKVITTL